jgi:pyruvate kinase
MRRTKIIATVGPATDSPQMLGQMVDAGVNLFRLNMSHASHDWIRRVVTDIRAVAAARQTAMGIIMDTQGPAIRTGDLPTPITLKPHQRFTLYVGPGPAPGPNATSVNYENFIHDISVGDTILLDNGEIHMKVLAKSANAAECEVLTEGSLGSRRHINLPGVKISLPALTAKDIADVQVGLEIRVDYIALSFVREAADLLQLKALIGTDSRRPRIIAKIEDQLAVKNLEEIVPLADGVMVARGDLGIECPYWELSVIQRRIVKTCLRIGRPVIVATQMLESMIENPMPTRAEITDITNAVYEQADAIMLSGETTTGRYPLRCVEVFDRIASHIGGNIERFGGTHYQDAADLTSPRAKLVKSAVSLANDLCAEALLIFTLRGTMAWYTAWMRPRHSRIIALCDHQEEADAIALFWGVTAVVVPFHRHDPEQTISGAVEILLQRRLLKHGDTTVIISSITLGAKIANAVQTRTL